MDVDAPAPSAQPRQPEEPAPDQVFEITTQKPNLISPQQHMVVDNVPAPIPDTSKDEEFARALQEEEIVSWALQ